MLLAILAAAAAPLLMGYLKRAPRASGGVEKHQSFDLHPRYQIVVSSKGATLDPSATPRACDGVAIHHEYELHAHWQVVVSSKGAKYMAFGEQLCA